MYAPTNACDLLTAYAHDDASLLTHSHTFTQQQPAHICGLAEEFARLTLPAIYLLWIYEVMKQVCMVVPDLCEHPCLLLSAARESLARTDPFACGLPFTCTTLLCPAGFVASVAICLVHLSTSVILSSTFAVRDRFPPSCRVRVD